MKALIFTFLFFICFVSEAQFFKKLQEKVNSKVDEKMNKTVDDVFDGNTKNKKSTTNSSKESPSSTEGNTKSNDTNYKPSTNSTVKLKPQYLFTGRMTYTVSSKNDNSSYKYQFLFNPNQPYSGINMNPQSNGGKDGDESYMVMDEGHSIVFINSSGMKMYVTSNTNKAMSSQFEDPMATHNFTDLKKSGQTKEIIGYKCEEYVFTNDNNTKYSIWVAPSLNMKDFGHTFSTSGGPIKGHTLEYSSTSSSGENQTIRATELSDNKIFIINSLEYKKAF